MGMTAQRQDSTFYETINNKMVSIHLIQTVVTVYGD